LPFYRTWLAATGQLQRTEGKGFVALVGVKLVAHISIDGGDEAEEEGMEVFAGGETRGNERFGEEVED
jgi:hypothetical protein